MRTYVHMVIDSPKLDVFLSSPQRLHLIITYEPSPLARIVFGWAVMAFPTTGININFCKQYRIMNITGFVIANGLNKKPV